MNGNRRWLLDVVAQYVVVVGGEGVSARVLIDGWAESSYIYALLYSSTEPIVLGADDVEVGFPEVVAVVSRVLHDG